MTAALHSTFQAVRGAILTGIGHGKSHTKPIRELQQNLSGKNTETTKVFVCGVIVSDGTARYPVIFNGKTYIVDRHILAALRSGETPETLELISVNEDAEPIEDEPGCSKADKDYQFRKEQF